MDENIADNGGLKDAYRAFKKLAYRRGRASLKTANNYTLDQLFFIGFGTVRQTDCLLGNGIEVILIVFRCGVVQKPKVI